MADSPFEHLTDELVEKAIAVQKAGDNELDVMPTEEARQELLAVILYGQSQEPWCGEPGRFNDHRDYVVHGGWPPPGKMTWTHEDIQRGLDRVRQERASGWTVR